MLVNVESAVLSTFGSCIGYRKFEYFVSQTMPSRLSDHLLKRDTSFCCADFMQML